MKGEVWAWLAVVRDRSVRVVTESVCVGEVRGVGTFGVVLILASALFLLLSICDELFSIS